MVQCIVEEPLPSDKDWTGGGNFLGIVGDRLERSDKVKEE